MKNNFQPIDSEMIGIAEGTMQDTEITLGKGNRINFMGRLCDGWGQEWEDHVWNGMGDIGLRVRIVGKTAGIKGLLMDEMEI